MSDELLDLVNEHDEVIGQQLRSEIYRNHSSNFRVVNAFIQNDKGELWIPRRSATKRIFPLCLDASMGGHIAAGESYLDALARELNEELRIDITSSDWREIGRLTPQEHHVSAFMKVFLLRTNDEPDYNKDDFIESFWFAPQDLLDRIAQGDGHKSDLPLMVRYLF